MTVRINLGCGRDYREGWLNVDMNRNVKTDEVVDLTAPLPWPDNYADEVLLDHVLEHIPRERLFKFLDELWRISKPDSTIRIHTPHYSGHHAFKCLAHYTYFGVGSFDMMKPAEMFNGQRYNKARFEVQEEPDGTRTVVPRS